MQKKRKKNKKNAISLKLIDLRKLLGMNQTEFAKHVGIGVRTLASWESGEIEPTIHKIKKILKTCSLHDLDAVLFNFSNFDWFDLDSNKSNLILPTTKGRDSNSMKNQTLYEKLIETSYHDKERIIGLLDEVNFLKEQIEILKEKKEGVGRKIS